MADLASVSPTTITRLEKGENLNIRTIDAVRKALERAGVVFLVADSDGPGVRLKTGR